MGFNTIGTRTIRELEDSRVYQRSLPTPAAPVASAATNVADTSFQANWSTVATAKCYGLTVARDAAFTQIVSGYNRLVVTDTTYVVTGLSLLTTYYYRVEAWDGHASGPSNTVTLTTVAVPVTAGLVLDLDAADIPVQTNGTDIVSWTSKEGLVFTKPSYAAGYPQYQANVVNGKPVARHVSTGLNRRLTCASASFNITSPTFFAVMAWKIAPNGLFRRGPGNRPQNNIGFGFNRQQAGLGADEYNTALCGVGAVATSVGAAGSSVPEPAAEANGVFHSPELRRTVGSGWAYYTNGSRRGGFSSDVNLTATVPTNVLFTCGYYDTGSSITDGLGREDLDLARLLLYNRTLTNAEANAVRAALGNQYNISVLQL